ncbi:MAG: hypothetical protein KDA61_20435, partial [Planctomycetales bacterium]|nr:hypothetical protein [Planctomycetales bacterium]
WWLLPALLVGGWLGVRCTLEASESKGASAAAVAAWIGYLVAIVANLDLLPLPGETTAWSAPIGLVAHTFALLSLTLFARYVVLDVQGLIDHPCLAADTTEDTTAATASPAPTAELPREESESDVDEAQEAVCLAMPQEYDANESSSHAEETERMETAWIDGSEPEWDESDGRPLSKSERKRLKKEKARRRAA